MFSCFQTPSLLSLPLPGLGSRAELLSLVVSREDPSQALISVCHRWFGTAKNRHQGQLRGQPCFQSLQNSCFFHSFSTMDARKTHFQVCRKILPFLSYEVFLIQQEKEPRKIYCSWRWDQFTTNPLSEINK